MIRFYVRGAQGIQQVIDPDLPPAREAIAWIDLLNPTIEEDHTVERLIGIEIPTKEDMREIELSSRVYNEDGCEFMTVLTVHHHGEDTIKTPVTFILTPTLLVTVRYNDLMTFSLYEKQLERKSDIHPQMIMLDIFEIMIDRIADKLEDLGDDIDTVSREVFDTPKVTVRRKTNMLQTSIRQIGAKGDLLGMLRESLASITRVLSHHAAEMAPDGKDVKIVRQKMNTMNRDVVSLNEHSAFLSGKMNFLLDATLGMISLEQNQIIKIFSVAAVIFLPPTLVASVYGMNFEHMPELASRYGYPVALAGMVVSAILPFLYFKKKGWL